MLNPLNTCYSAMTDISKKNTINKAPTLETEKSDQAKTPESWQPVVYLLQENTPTQEQYWKLHEKSPSQDWSQKGGQQRDNRQTHVTVHNQRT